MEEEDVRGDRGLSVFRLRAVSRLTLVVRCTEIGYSVSTQVLGFRFGCGWCCVVGFLFGCCWFCVLLLCVSAWWNRGIADEVTMASYGRAVTGTAVMARSANEEKKKKYIQSRVLVKRARLTVKRGAARPNGKSKPPQSPLRRAVRYRIRGARHRTTKEEDGGGERNVARGEAPNTMEAQRGEARFGPDLRAQN